MEFLMLLFVLLLDEKDIIMHSKQLCMPIHIQVDSKCLQIQALQWVYLVSLVSHLKVLD